MMAPHEPFSQTSMISLTIADPPNDSIMASHHQQEQVVDEPQTQTQTQMELTQQTLELTTQLGEDEMSNLMMNGSQSPVPPLSPQPALPWGRLLPCSISGFRQAFDLFHRPAVPVDTTSKELFNIFWLGRSHQCDVTATVASSNKSKKNDAVIQAWAHSMISNKHCRIFCSHNHAGELEVYIEDYSGNGTLINQTTLLRKGEKRLLHSGDEICLVNLQTLRKKIRSNRVLQPLLQQHSFVFVLHQPLPTPVSTNQKQRKTPCVNPRAMNYVPHQQQPQQQPPDPTSTSSSSSPRRIEQDYDIRDVIGDGTCGQVRRAIHRQTGEPRAVKIISLRRNRMLVDSTQMEQEATILRSLDHPYIVKLVDVFVNPGVAMYLVMELVAGGDLFDRIVQQRSYTEVDSRRVMRRLFSAVHYLHEQRNIVHRDLKPENILCVTRDDHIQVKLTDFGLAKIINEDDSLKTFCGTPQYFAPEVLRRRHTVAGRGRYGKPADMWSLGVILYILLSGQPPFNPDDFDEDDDRSQYNIEFPTDPWSQFHPLAVDLVQKLLREDPKRRLTVSQACTHPWIMMEDGDTHIHPLDDPNLTTRKKLFGSPEQQQPPEGEEQEENSYHMATDETSAHSTIKDEDCNSILSKESFSAAARDISHRRNQSVFDVVVGEAFLQVLPQDAAAADTKESPTTTPMEDDDDKTAEVGSSPNKLALLASGTNLGESSVTPSEIGDTPRSPLAAMTLNERSNRFREQILVKSNSSSSNTRSPKDDDGDDDDLNPSPTREQQDMIRPAVTPTASNITKRKGSLLEQPFLEGAAELEDDEICSRFSDQTESLQSFPSSHADSPVATTLPEVEESLLRKRPRPATEMTAAAVPESPKRKQQRQMTLSGWFVKKTTPAISMDEKES